jgi:cyanate lyase
MDLVENNLHLTKTAIAATELVTISQKDAVIANQPTKKFVFQFYGMLGIYAFTIPRTPSPSPANKARKYMTLSGRAAVRVL